MAEKYHLTPVEYELMEILWKIEEGTVRDVIAHLPANRQLAYTSVSTILRILQQKKALTAKKYGRQHIYKPILTKDLFATNAVKKMLKQIFSGDSTKLVAYLVDRHDLSIDEINAIQTLLETKKKEITE